MKDIDKIAEEMETIMGNLTTLIDSMDGIDKFLNDTLNEYKHIPEVQELKSIKEADEKRIKNGGKFDSNIIKRYESIIERLDKKEN